MKAAKIKIHFLTLIWRDSPFSCATIKCNFMVYYDGYVPAVSQICSFIFCPDTSIIRVPNSTPIVCGQSAITTIIQMSSTHSDDSLIVTHRAELKSRSTNGSISSDYGRQLQARAELRSGHIFN